MNEARRMKVKNTIFLRAVEKEGIGVAGMVAEAVALGIETALAWHEDEAVRDGWVPSEAGSAWHEGDQVLAAEGIDVSPAYQRWMQDPTSAEPDAALVERNLRSVLDTVLEYLAMRDGWVPIDLEEHRVREVAVAVMIKGWIERNGIR